MPSVAQTKDEIPFWFYLPLVIESCCLLWMANGAVGGIFCLAGAALGLLVYGSTQSIAKKGMAINEHVLIPTLMMCLD